MKLNRHDEFDDGNDKKLGATLARMLHSKFKRYSTCALPSFVDIPRSKVNAGSELLFHCLAGSDLAEERTMSVPTTRTTHPQGKRAGCQIPLHTAWPQRTELCTRLACEMQL